MPVHPVTGAYTKRYSQAARDADARAEKAKANPEVWGDNPARPTEAYADYIEQMSLEHAAYFVIAGDLDTARLMLTQSLSQSLMGNEGE